MAVVKTERVILGVSVIEYTNTSTGKIQIFEKDDAGVGGTLLAESSSAEWEIVNIEDYKNLYAANNQTSGTSELTDDEFKALFQEEAVPIFNGDRADVLNNNENYESIEVAENNRRQFAQVDGIPGVQDPTTGQYVNSRGELTDEDPFANEEDIYEGSNDGTSNQGDYQNPNYPYVTETPNTDIILRYPIHSNNNQDQDYLKITVKSYEPNGINNSATGGTAKGVIILPMQAGLSETRVIDWNDDEMTIIEKTLGDLAMGGSSVIADAVQGKGTSKGGLRRFDDAMGRLQGNLRRAANSDVTKDFIMAHLAQKSLGSNITGRTTGAVLNNNLELLFNGPKLRQFNYSYLMTPRDKKESQMIRKIIYKLKKHSSPKGREQNVFLKAPDLFQLEYIFGGDKGESGERERLHPYLNEFKECALTNMSVDYTPDGSYMTYGDGGMTSYRLNLTFHEIKPVYNLDFPHEGSEMTMGF